MRHYAKKKESARCEILELADNIGAEVLLKELVQQMSEQEARDFIDYFKNNY